MKSSRDVIEKYTDQARDAAASLGLSIESFDLPMAPRGPVSIYLGGLTGETTALAAAVLLEAPDATVLAHDFTTGATLMFREKVATMVNIFDLEIDYAPTEMSAARLPGLPYFGNARNFKYYSENKYLSHMLLRMAGLKVPKQLRIGAHRLDSFTVNSPEEDYDKSLESDFGRVIDFIMDNNLSKIVLKPSTGKGGGDVIVCSFPDFLLRGTNHIIQLPVDDDILIQEKVDSYPVYEGEQRMDWNLRVLVTYDHEMEKYVVAGLVGRIDKDGAPVNRSISADYISFDEVMERAGVDPVIAAETALKVEAAATKAVEAVVARGNKEQINWPDMNYQDLAGVDIIVDENLEPVILEVNDSNSGCAFELMKLHGPEALRPIARAFLKKAEGRRARKGPNGAFGVLEFPMRKASVEGRKQPRFSTNKITLKNSD